MAHVQVTRVRAGATLPARATPGSAGLDLAYCGDRSLVVRLGVLTTMIPTGIAVAIPPGHVGLLCIRSSLARRGAAFANGVGVIDSDYRGELVCPTLSRVHGLEIMPGERIGQLVIVPCWMGDVVEVTELPSTERGAGGFGSTGRGVVASEGSR